MEPRSNLQRLAVPLLRWGMGLFLALSAGDALRGAAAARGGGEAGAAPSEDAVVLANRLRNVNDLPERVDLELEGERVLIRHPAEPDEDAARARPRNVGRDEPVEVPIGPDGVRLSLRLRSEPGGKVRTSSPDGRRVWVDLTVSSDRQPSPVTYPIPFRLD